VAVVEGNRQHLRQVICNLLDNALKFTQAGGRVSVELTLDRAANAMVLVVEDSGAGIPEDDIGHIFERFFQGNRMRSGTPEQRGTGLGLSICHAIVQAHDGTIDVHSRVGKGTRFTVRLPLSSDQEISAGPDVLFSPSVATRS
jgi:signal transduction histidine kinase